MQVIKVAGVCDYTKCVNVWIDNWLLLVRSKPGIGLGDVDYASLTLHLVEDLFLSAQRLANDNPRVKNVLHPAVFGIF